jgi:hypothetical protein
MKIAPLLLVSALATTSASLSNASSLLINGSFEDTYSTGPGVTALPGWTVSSGNIDLGYFATAPDGGNAIDLTGSGGGGAGVIYQDFDTVAGASYSLSFYFGANGGWQYYSYPNDSPIKSMKVLLDGVELGLFSKDTTGWAEDKVGWEEITLTFTATNNSSRLTFQSLNGANGTVFGPTLDGVVVTEATVSEVPIPGTLGLLGIGLAGLGFVRRKSKA